MRRLYAVRISGLTYVLAESEQDAINTASAEAFGADTEEAEYTAARVRPADFRPAEWEPDALVYGAEDEVTLADAWPVRCPECGGDGQAPATRIDPETRLTTTACEVCDGSGEAP